MRRASSPKRARQERMCHAPPRAGNYAYHYDTTRTTFRLFYMWKSATVMRQAAARPCLAALLSYRTALLDDKKKSWHSDMPFRKKSLHPPGRKLPRTFSLAVARENFSGLVLLPILLNGSPQNLSIPGALLRNAHVGHLVSSRQESNPHYILRKDASYPLNDGRGSDRVVEKTFTVNPIPKLRGFS